MFGQAPQSQGSQMIDTHTHAFLCMLHAECDCEVAGLGLRQAGKV